MDCERGAETNEIIFNSVFKSIPYLVSFKTSNMFSIKSKKLMKKLYHDLTEYKVIMVVSQHWLLHC